MRLRMYTYHWQVFQHNPTTAPPHPWLGMNARKVISRPLVMERIVA